MAYTVVYSLVRYQSRKVNTISNIEGMLAFMSPAHRRINTFTYYLYQFFPASRASTVVYDKSNHPMKAKHDRESLETLRKPESG